MVEQHELFGERVRVGRHVASVHHELRIARALADVAEHLVVRTVFLDDVHHVFNRRRFARSLRHRTRRNVGPWRDRESQLHGITRERKTIVLGNARRICREFGVGRHRNDVHRAAVCMDKPIALSGMSVYLAFAGADTK